MASHFVSVVSSCSTWRRRPRGGAAVAPLASGVFESPHPDFFAPPTGTLCQARARTQSGSASEWAGRGARDRPHRVLVLILLHLTAPRGTNSSLLTHGAIELVRLHHGAVLNGVGESLERGGFKFRTHTMSSLCPIQLPYPIAL